MNRKNKPTEAQIKNSRTYQHYLDRFTLLGISMFEWKNLPSSVDPRFLELTLFGKGFAVFFKDEVMGYLCLPCTIGTPLNVYNIPTERVAYANNGYQNYLNETNSVLIYNNYLRTNSQLGVEEYAYRIANIERTIDINVNGQKTPIIITCKENQRLTLKNIILQALGNEPVIYGYKNIDTDSLNVLKLDIPYNSDKLNQLKKEYYNECLTYLGISNVNEQKKERLLTDEVERNQGGINAQKFTRLDARKDACKQINEMFGLNIDVEYRTSPEEVEEQYQKLEDGEEDE